MEESAKEQKKLAVTKLEMKVREVFKALKQEMLHSPIKARIKIEKLRSEYILQSKFMEMFVKVGLVREYTNLLNEFNRVLDGDLT